MRMLPPSRPVVGVGAVLAIGGRVLLVRRAKEPLKGRWTLPGGTVELGETLEEAVVRELEEETGLCVAPRELLSVFDRIHRETGRVAYHYVIVDYLCERISGELRAGSDAAEVALAAPSEFDAYDLPDKARELALEGLRKLGASSPGGSAAGPQTSGA
jgi:mutator protein MutT